ncbi:MAG: XdhC family protein, partial [Saprospiraceae bacterium]|nr:XdhC family protein [Saprospiraceae bacterium]
MFASGCIVWDQLAKALSGGERAVLLYVLRSEGSSPGRRGFVMCVQENGEIHGTIGGGIMEHKLVELARSMIENQSPQAVLKEQQHSKDHPVNQSGMICSGSQYIALIPLMRQDLPI